MNDIFAYAALTFIMGVPMVGLLFFLRDIRNDIRELNKPKFVEFKDVEFKRNIRKSIGN